MKALHADPEFAAANRERNRERLKALNADPEFAAANRERMKALHADPEFAAANRERLKALNADPRHNPLAALSPADRADYDVLRTKGGYGREEALAMIGRHDLLPKREAAE
jgi:hypothetical protein